MKGHTLSRFEVEARRFSVGHLFRHLILILSLKKKGLSVARTLDHDLF